LIDRDANSADIGMVNAAKILLYFVDGLLRLSENRDMTQDTLTDREAEDLQRAIDAADDCGDWQTAAALAAEFNAE
jgi:hypothetical protein